MATPAGPPFNHFIHNLEGHLGEVKRAVSDREVHFRVQKLFLVTIQNIETQLEDKKKQLSTKDLTSSLSLENERQALVKCISLSEKVGASGVEKIHRMAQNLLKHLNVLEEFAHHYEGLEADIVAFKGKEWLQDELRYLLIHNDPWAKEKLAELAQSDDPWAFEMLWKLGGKLTNIQVYLKDSLRKAGFIEALHKILLDPKNASQLSKLVPVLKVCLEDEEVSEIYDLLRRTCSESPRDDLYELVALVLKETQGLFSFYDSIVQGLMDNVPFAFEVFARFFQKFENALDLESNLFFQFLISDSKCSVNTQIFLLAAASLYSANLAIADVIMLKMRNEVSMGSERASKVLRALERGAEVIALDLEFLEEDTFQYMIDEYNHYGINGSILEGDFFSFKTMPIQFQLEVMTSLLKRKEALINFFTSEVITEEYEDHLFQEPAVAPNHFFLNPTDKQFKLVESLSKTLGKEGVKFVLCAPQSIDFDSSAFSTLEGVELVEGTLGASIWIRDYLFQFQKSHRLSAFTRYAEEYKVNMKVERIQRVAFKMPIARMGKGLDNHDQLYIFEYLSQVSSKFRGEEKKTRFQFLYHEGGNVIMGQSQGQDYVIIGKDAFGINRRRLQFELAELGLTIDHGKWELAEPYDDKIHTLSRSDSSHVEYAYMENTKILPTIPNEALIKLMQLDFGLAKVHLVEQPEYHLDVAMALVNPEKKIVWLNDSEMAFRVYEDYQKDLKAEDVDAAVAPHFDERLQKVKEKAKRLKELEDLTHKDLEANGFIVVRVPGIFEQHEKVAPEEHRINFFNYIPYKGQDRSDGIVALGCPLYFQKLFSQLTAEHMPHIKKIHFADEEESKKLLFKNGGLHCVIRHI